ncbi:MAG: hypothetical protein II921_09265, partial [Treponema sp.]|nr:hypothetical protein [Treponema sp.]
NNTIAAQKKQIDDLNKQVAANANAAKQNADLNKQVADLNTTIANQKKQLDDLNKQNAANANAAKQAADLNKQIANLNNTIASQKKQLDDLNKQNAANANAAKQAADLNKQIANLNTTIANQKKQIDDLTKAAQNQASSSGLTPTQAASLLKKLDAVDVPQYPMDEQNKHLLITKTAGAYVSVEWNDGAKIVILPEWLWNELEEYKNAVNELKNSYKKAVDNSAVSSR